jgi:hypothetical protein
MDSLNHDRMPRSSFFKKPLRADPPKMFDPSSTVGAMGRLGNPQKSAILGSTKLKV